MIIALYSLLQMILKSRIAFCWFVGHWGKLAASMNVGTLSSIHAFSQNMQFSWNRHLVIITGTAV